MNNVNEPGPSRTQQTPLLTQVSQQTLVERSPATQQELINEVHPVQDDPSQAQEQAQTAVAETPVVAVENDAVTRPALRTRSRQQVATQVASKASAYSKPSGRVTRSDVARKVVSQHTFTVGDNAPYRNTRSRSRSVEPVSLEIVHARTRNKAKPTLSVVQDVPDEEGADSEPPVGETMEEQDVVDQLVERLHAHDASNDRAAGEGKLDSDDRQTDDALRGPSHVQVDESDSESENIVARLRKARKSQRGPATASEGIFTTRPLVPVAAQGRKESQPESSGESNGFPSRGTRAFKARTHLERKERRRPYEPPRGTRAAALRR
jgi:hypothetical protein